jgi:hypothetical protein
MHHGARRLEEAGFADMMPCFFLIHCADDVLPESFVACAVSHLAIEIVLDV